jgi:hypothetical protein
MRNEGITDRFPGRSEMAIFTAIRRLLHEDWVAESRIEKFHGGLGDDNTLTDEDRNQTAFFAR